MVGPGAGGAARRLTNHPGTEEAAKFSPDGKTLVFTGEYDGAPSLYVMPATGGSAEAPHLLRRRRPGRGVDAGRQEDRVPVEPRGDVQADDAALHGVARGRAPRGAARWIAAILCSFSPDGTKLAYNRRGIEEYYWKRYKGGRYVDLWLYDFASRQYTQLSDYVGKSAYPMYAARQAVLRVRPRREGHQQSLHDRPGHEEGRAR